MSERCRPGPRRLAPALVLGLLATGIGVAEAEVRGTITDADGAPLVGAMVSAWDEERRASITVFSDVEGGFELPGLRPGNHRVTARRIGFETGVLDRVAPGGPPLRLALPPKADFAEDLPAAYWYARLE